MTAQLTVTLTKAGRTKIRYPATLVADTGDRISVSAPWAADGVRDFGFVRFEPGDVFTEHFWRSRWYAIKEVRTGEGVLKGWYCDVTRPAVASDGDVLVEDLLVRAEGPTPRSPATCGPAYRCLKRGRSFSTPSRHPPRTA